MTSQADNLVKLAVGCLMLVGGLVLLGISITIIVALFGAAGG